MKPWESDPLRLTEARKLKDYWQGRPRQDGRGCWSAEIRKAPRGMYRVRIW